MNIRQPWGWPGSPQRLVPGRERASACRVVASPKIVLATVAVFAVALAAFVATGHASVYYGWKWPTPAKGPVRIRVVTDQQFPKALTKSLKDAAKGWEKSGAFKLDVSRPVASCDVGQPMTICVQAAPGAALPCGAADSDGRYPGGCANVNAADTPPADGSPWQATEGWVGFNTDYLNAGPVWWQHVLCHELGHTLGLGHSEDGPTPFPPSCMSNDNNTPTPSQDDLMLLRSLYTSPEGTR